MTIIFEQIPAVQAGAGGGARLRIEGRGAADGNTGRALMRIHGTGRGYFTAVPAPPVMPAYGNATLRLHGAGTGYLRNFGNGAATLQLHFRGYSAMAGGTTRLVMQSSGRELREPAGYGLMIGSGLVMQGYGGRWFETLVDELMLGARQAGTIIATLRSMLCLDAGGAGRFKGMSAVTDVLNFDERMVLTWIMLVEEGVAFGESVGGNLRQIVRIIDRLILTGQVQTHLQALETVIAAVAFGGLTAQMAVAGVDDRMVLGETITELVHAAEQLVSSLVLADVASGSTRVTMLVEDSLVFSSEAVGAAKMAAYLADSIGFAVHLSIDNGDYIAWVLNTESKGLSQYTHFPFNSFAQIGGRYYGAATTGLYRLEGDDYDGAPIESRIRLGLSAMGTRREKRVPEAFIGYRSDGTLLMRVMTIDERIGEKVESVYKLDPCSAANIRENRFKFGRGLKSVDWDFVIENVDGADFDLDSIEFRPVVLDRRTRG
ncbi:MAG: hypothetical protein LBL59_08700 [Xanthomonadaceae bacterium]|nr:hypothetical protein [Xanthomonadaceae bacterium]